MNTHRVTLGLVSALALPSVQAANWGYPEQGASWGSRFITGSQCDSTTVQQSPIDFTQLSTPAQAATATVTLIPPGQFDPHDNNVVFASQVRVTLSQNGTVVFSHKYLILGYHFHFGAESGTPTEHQLSTWVPAEGSRTYGELHIVGSSPAGNGVFSIALAQDSVGPAPTVLDTFLVAANQAYVSPASTQSADVMPLLGAFSTGAFFSYSGSLTTPPCSGGVQWFVLQTPLKYGGNGDPLYTLGAGLNKAGLIANNVRGTKTAPTLVYTTSPALPRSAGTAPISSAGR